MSSSIIFLLFAPLLLTFPFPSLCFSGPARPRFRDHSIFAGLRADSPPALIKYGGAAVADLDADGLPDLIFGHHTEPRVDVFWNAGNGRFVRADWTQHLDLHGVSPIRLSPSHSAMHFILSRGGSSGTQPKIPLLMTVGMMNRSVEDVTEVSGLEPHGRGRGRATQQIYFNRDNITATQGPGIVFMNARLTEGQSTADDADHNFIFLPSPDGVDGPLLQFAQYANGSALGFDDNHHLSVTDTDGDGFPELLTFHQLRVYAVGARAPGAFDRISDAVLQRLGDVEAFRGVQSVAELDYDNDGRWDVFVARTSSGNLKWRNSTSGRLRPSGDRLLRNTGGRYADVSAMAGIPRGRAGQTQGVTAGDFNNDGWIDVLVLQYEAPDYILLNNGDGTFSVADAGLGRDAAMTRGDMATAVDVDMDGWLEIVVSEGEWFDTNYAGHYKIFKNHLAGAATNAGVGNYLLVRVRNSPSGNVTSLHATATVEWIDGNDDQGTSGMKLHRRVGAPGTAVSNSYVETLHFGIGSKPVVKRVSVRWVNGETEEQTNVYANTLLTFGE